MRVLFINTVDKRGSTGRICREIGEAVERDGGEYRIAFGRGQVTDAHGYRIGSDLSLRHHALMARLFDRAGFFSRRATKKFLAFLREYNPDIIHLHNLHGYYLHLPTLFTYLKEEFRGKVVWTLHDCWAFTGHCCHYTRVRCSRWQSECHSCPQRGEYPRSLFLDSSRRNFRDKQRLFTGVGQMTLVTVSHWLEDEVRKSFLGEYPILTVYNGIDFSRFRPVENNVRKRHGIEGKLILSVSDGWTEGKGLRRILEVAHRADDSFRFIVIGLSEKQLSALPPNVIGLPRTASQSELIEYYSAADVFFNPSTEETFGLVTAEAIACGTPALVMRSTACHEVVLHSGGGRILEPDADSDACLAALDSLAKEATVPDLRAFSIEEMQNAYVRRAYSCNK